jgi:hypothetical protein
MLPVPSWHVALAPAFVPIEAHAHRIEKDRDAVRKAWAAFYK